MFCTNCGSGIEDDDRFCPSCGSEVGLIDLSAAREGPVTIGGRFRLEGVLGRGAGGTVYLAHDESLGGAVALKSLDPVLASLPEFLSRFRVEAATLATMAHPNIVGVREYVEEPSGCYLVMERVEGPSLRQLLTTYRRLAPEQACGVLAGALSGLGYVHDQGILHGDVKPENVLVDMAGVSQLTDFGQAVPLGSSASGGSAAYMSPEAIGGSVLSEPSDLYSLGAVLYECLAGQPPFAADQLPSVLYGALNDPPPPIQGLASPMADLLGRALAKDPAQRPQSATEFLAQLNDAARRSYGSDWMARAGVAALAGAIGVGVAVALGTNSAGAAMVTSAAAAPSGASTPGISSVAKGAKTATSHSSRWLPKTLLANKAAAAAVSVVVVAGAVTGGVVALSHSSKQVPLGSSYVMAYDNTTHDVHAYGELSDVTESANGDIAGQLTVDAPLEGSGPIVGKVNESSITFTVTTTSASFKGQVGSPGTMSGTFVTGDQGGTWRATSTGNAPVHALNPTTTPGNGAVSVAASAEPGALSGVATIPGGNAWAVGYSGTNPHTNPDTNPDTKALILSWNGSAWKPVSTPSPPGAVLNSVAATSSTNAWAVGSSGDLSNSNTLILHWNGTIWQQMPSIAGTLSGVAATSPTNTWAVGATNSGETLILHWNGKTWQQMPSIAGNLTGVTATSPTNAWAVGGTNTSTLILHWNGKTWLQEEGPNPGSGQGLASFLSSVAVATGGSIWAVGNGNNCGCGPGSSLIERWNGQTWGQLPSPTFGGGLNLVSVASLPSGRSWAVGLSGSGDGPTSGVILQWTGTTWTRVSIPELRGVDGGLSGVAATSDSNAWAVGQDGAGGASGGTPKIMILHWTGSAWKASLPLARAPRVEATATTTAPPTTAASAILGSAAWGLSLTPTVEGFGTVAPSAIASGLNLPADNLLNVTWSNWGAPQATGEGQTNDSKSDSDAVTVVAFDLGNCNGGPPAYEEVTWYFPQDGQTFDPAQAINACTGAGSATGTDNPP